MVAKIYEVADEYIKNYCGLHRPIFPLSDTMLQHLVNKATPGANTRDDSYENGFYTAKELGVECENYHLSFEACLVVVGYLKNDQARLRGLVLLNRLYQANLEREQAPLHAWAKKAEDQIKLLKMEQGVMGAELLEARKPKTITLTVTGNEVKTEVEL